MTNFAYLVIVISDFGVKVKGAAETPGNGTNDVVVYDLPRLFVYKVSKQSLR